MLNILEESRIFLRAVNELQDVHCIAFEVFIRSVVVHFGDSCGDVVENWEHVKTKVNFLVL